MKAAYKLVVIGSILIFIPTALIAFWPVAQSQNMPSDISRYPNSYYAPHAERISSWDDPRLMRSVNESDMDFSSRVLSSVHNATYHCESHNYYQSWFTWLSYKLGIYSLMPGNNQGVLDIKTFRCGFCHQRAYILARVLRNGGIESARVLGLGGHVITVFNYNQELYSIDSDFGVGPVIITGLDSPNSEVDPQIEQRLWDTYNPITQAWGDGYTQNIIDIYITRDNNKYYNINKLDLLRLYQSLLFSFELLIEYFLFILGSLLLLLGIYMRLKKIQDINGLNQHFNLPRIKNSGFNARPMR